MGMILFIFGLIFLGIAGVACGIVTSIVYALYFLTRYRRAKQRSASAPQL